MSVNPRNCLTLLNRLSLGIVSCLLLALFVTTALASNEEQEVRASFKELQSALISKNGATALNLLSSDTKDYYQMLSRIISTPMTKEALAKQNLTPLNMFMVRHVKQSLPKNFWNNYKNQKTPDKLLKFAVEKGLGSRELTDDIRLGTVRISGNTATGALIKGSKALPLQMVFHKESGKWKVNLISMLEQVNSMAENFLNKAGLKIEDLEKLMLKNSAPKGGL